MSVVTDSVALREPAHQVSPRAVTYWRVSALIGAVVLWIIASAVYTFALPERPWWATAIFVVALGYAIRRAKHKGALEHPLIVDPPGPEEFPGRSKS